MTKHLSAERVATQKNLAVRNVARMALAATGLVHVVAWVVLTMNGIRTIAAASAPGRSTTSAAGSTGAPPPAAPGVLFYVLLLVTGLVTAAVLSRAHLPGGSGGRQVTPLAESAPARVPLAVGYPADLRTPVVGGGRGAIILTFALIVVAQDCRILLELVTGGRAMRAPAGSSTAEPADLVKDIGTSISAGVWEELALFALPVAMMTLHGWCRGRRLVLVIGVVMVLRLGIHLYYGIGATMVIPWMIGAVLLYRAVGSVWPLVIGHALFDIWVAVVNHLQLPAGTIQIGQHLVVAAALVVLWRSMHRAEWRAVYRSRRAQNLRLVRNHALVGGTSATQDRRERGPDQCGRRG